MHESGQYPSNDAEITNLLSEMHDCLVTVLSFVDSKIVIVEIICPDFSRALGACVFCD